MRGQKRLAKPAARRLELKGQNHRFLGKRGALMTRKALIT